jgi:hypothetical protein
MSNSIFRSRGTTLAAACLVALAACDPTDDAIAPRPGTQTGLSIDLQVSGARVATGEKVAVAIGTSYIGKLGGLQGYLEFDPSRLRYVGQDESARSILVVNADKANIGRLRVATMNASGIQGRAATLVFEVLGAGYTYGLGFRVEEAATAKHVALIKDVSVSRIVREVPDLLVPSEVQALTVQQLGKALGAGDIVLNTPGQYVLNLKYGDATLDGTISLSDALDVLGTAVGANEMITGTDSPSRDRVIAANVFPSNTPGLGEPSDALPPGAEIIADGSAADTVAGSLTLSDALTILSEGVGLDQPVAGELIPGRGALASTTQNVSADITASTTWTKDKIWVLTKKIRVTNGATLTIQAGTTIQGSTSPDSSTQSGALFVQRDGWIIADGTAREPIVFTCTSGTKFKGCWGGLVINGNSHFNRDAGSLTPGVTANGITRSTAGCKENPNGEGDSGPFGGCNDADSSGVLRYVRVEYAGRRFNTENELNGIAFQAVGNKTIVDYVQSHASLDDGVEFFGGSVNVKHLYLTANEDDSFDFTEGYNGMVQYVIIQHDPLDSDKGIEADNCNPSACFDATPRSTPQIYNITMYGKPTPSDSVTGSPANNSNAGLHIRRGAHPTVANAIVMNFTQALDIDDNATCSTTDGPLTIKNSIFTQNFRLDAKRDVADGSVGGIGADADGSCGSEDLWLQDAARNNLFPVTTPVRDPANKLLPDWRPTVGQATSGAITPPANGFFDAANAQFMGAVPPAVAGNGNIPWYSGWTRGWQSSTQP